MTRIVCCNSGFLRTPAPLPGADPHAKYRAALESIKVLGVNPLDLLAYAVFAEAEEEMAHEACCESVEAHLGVTFAEEGGYEDDIQHKAKQFAREAAARAEWESRGD